MTSMNLMNVYHDTALDAVIGQSTRNSRYAAAQRKDNGYAPNRRSMSEEYQTMQPMPPPAPDVPRGPPIAYRTMPQENGIQRSFSQRARGRPFAKEAFSDIDDEPIQSAAPQRRATSDFDNENYESRLRHGTQHENGLDNRPQRRATSNTYEKASQPRPRPSEQIEDTPHSVPQRRATTDTYDEPYEPPGKPRAQKVPPLRLDTENVQSKPSTHPQKGIKASPNGYELTPTKSQSRQRPTSSAYSGDVLSASSRTAALRDSGLVDQEEDNDWAPQKSPLQKLEVTLNSISKEEKRARVQEAEMRIRREDGNSHRVSSVAASAQPDKQPNPGRSASQRHKAQVDPQTASVPTTEGDRSLNTAQRQRLRHSGALDSHKPGLQEIPGSRSNDPDYEDRPGRHISSGTKAKATATTARPHVIIDQDESRKPVAEPRQIDQPFISEATYAVPSRGASKRQAAATSNNEYSPVAQPSDYLPGGHLPMRNASGRPSQTTTGEIGTRTVSAPQRASAASYLDQYQGVKESPTVRERNASHQAALDKLTGASTAAVTSRSGSRKLQKAPPVQSAQPAARPKSGQTQPPQQPTSNAPQPAHAATQPARSKTGQMQPTHNAAQPVQAGGTNLQPPLHPGTLQQGGSTKVPPPHRKAIIGSGITDSPRSQPPSSSVDTFDTPRQKGRRPSVSFKEPYSRRPVGEWKQAGTARLSIADLALERPNDHGFEKSKTWWEGGDSTRRRSGRGAANPEARTFDTSHVIDDRTAQYFPQLFVKCGPLLRYTGMKSTRSDPDFPSPDNRYWRGSVMIVTQDSRSSYGEPPTLRLFSQPKRLLPPPPAHVTGEELAPEYVDPIAGLTKVSRTGALLYVRPVDHLEEGRDLSRIEDDTGLFETSPSLLDEGVEDGVTAAATNKRTLGTDGERMGRFQEVRGARLYGDPDRDVTFWRFNIEVKLGDQQQHIAYRINRGPAIGFWVPARDQSMNIMFHSCNGFSLSVNPDQFSGPDPLWRDVLNTHQTRPFHVMIGGGDQLYNDRVMLDTQHFADWTQIKNPHHKHEAPFTTEMKHELEKFYLDRYAMWFSQGLFGLANCQIPMINIWDDHDIIDGFGSYPDKFMRSPVFSGIGNVAFKYYMLFQHQSVPEETAADEPSWILGHRPGPYITQKSRSTFMHLGKHVAFLGVDCRTERTKDEVITLNTTDLVLDRCRKEIIEGETKHLIVLLGVPIAYPRLVWLENMLTSKALDPIKALGRAGILKTTLFNKFDGGVEILDDLDDHWTASHHKAERNELVKELQDLAAEKSVRITILSGDIYLAAIGQFYSNPKLKIPKDRDHRYMPNVVSSAIVNTPPPDMLADIINRRNKIHHLDHYTDESMIPMFTYDVNDRKRSNKHLLPRRNWCSIREYVPGSTPPPTPPDSPFVEDDEPIQEQMPKRRFSFTKGDANPRALFRRLSSRNAPPSSYRDDVGYDQQRSVSYDGTQGAPGMLSKGSRQNSLDNMSRRASSLDRISTGPLRPNFQRRPTNLSEKAAKKGNVPAIDAEGNEIDINDSVNLEGGLDIVLNCEVNPRDPAGITTPYRILIPALWYDGSSDREKLDSAAGVQPRPGLLGRLSFGGSQRNKATSNQGAGEWAEDDEDYQSGNEEDQPLPPPKSRFNLFGRRQKSEQYYDDDFAVDDEQAQDMPLTSTQTAPDGVRPQSQRRDESYDEDQPQRKPRFNLFGRRQKSEQYHDDDPAVDEEEGQQLPHWSAQPAPERARPQSQRRDQSYEEDQPRRKSRFNFFGRRQKEEQYYDDESDLDDEVPHDEQAQDMPAVSSLPEPETFTQHSRPGNYLYGTDAQQSRPQQGDQARGSRPQRGDQLYDTTNLPPSSHQPNPSSKQQRRSSFTIGGRQDYPSPTANTTNPPPQRQSSTPSHYNPHPQPQPQSQAQPRQSKAERMLGMNTIPSSNDQPPSYSNPPGHALRGNGIIGNPAYGAPTSSSNEFNDRRGRGSSGGQAPPSAYPATNSSRPGSSGGSGGGYSGIEAYKEPGRRRWSFKGLTGRMRSLSRSRREQQEEEEEEEEEEYYSDEGDEGDDVQGQHDAFRRGFLS